MLYSKPNIWSEFPLFSGHLSFVVAQDPVGFLGLKCTLCTHINLYSHQNPQVPFYRAAFIEFSQSASIPGIALTLVLGLVETPRVFKLSESFWMAFLLLYQLHNSVSSANLLSAHSVSFSRSLIKKLKSASFKMDPWGLFLVASLHLGMDLLTTILCLWLIPTNSN